MIGVKLANLITPAVLNTGQIDNTAVADDSITTPKVQDAAITDAKIEDGTITGASIAANTIGTGNLVSASVDNTIIAADAVNTDQLVAGAVLASKIGFGLGTGEVNTDELPEGINNQFFTDLRAIEAVEGEATLDLSGAVDITGTLTQADNTIGDYSLSGTYDATGLQIVADNNRWGAIEIREFGSSGNPFNIFNPGFNTVIGEGTAASPTAVGDSKRIFSMGGTAFNGTTQPSSSNILMIGSTTEAQTSTNRGAKMEIQTIANGSTSRSTTARFAGDDTTLINLIASGTVVLENLPTTDPSNAGQLWNDSGTLKVSAG